MAFPGRTCHRGRHISLYTEVVLFFFSFFSKTSASEERERETTTDLKNGGSLNRLTDVASSCFRIKLHSRDARVIEDSILENCQPRHQIFSLTFLTEKPWDEFGR